MNICDGTCRLRLPNAAGTATQFAHSYYLKNKEIKGMFNLDLNYISYQQYV